MSVSEGGRARFPVSTSCLRVTSCPATRVHAGPTSGPLRDVASLHCFHAVAIYPQNDSAAAFANITFQSGFVFLTRALHFRPFHTRLFGVMPPPHTSCGSSSWCLYLARADWCPMRSTPDR